MTRNAPTALIFQRCVRVRANAREELRHRFSWEAESGEAPQSTHEAAGTTARRPISHSTGAATITVAPIASAATPIASSA